MNTHSFVLGNKTKVVDAEFVNSVPSMQKQTLTVTPPSRTVVKGSNKATLDLSKATGSDVVMFGSECQREMSHTLDDILSHITKGTSPILFELFQQLKKGYSDTNLPELEEKIRESLNTTWYQKLTDKIGLTSSVKRLQNSNSAIEGMFTRKTKSLLELTQHMEDHIQTEVVKLISDSKRLTDLAAAYRKNMGSLEEVCTQGDYVLESSRSDLAKIRPSDEESNALVVQDYKEYQQRIDLFESRLIVLKTALASAPAQLEKIRLGQGASFSTLAETANTSVQKFNNIKSGLIDLSVTLQIKNVQQLNEETNNLETSLQNYSSTTLGQVAVNAARAQGLNRVNDVNKLLTLTQGVVKISDDVMNEYNENKKRNEEVKIKLLEVQTLLKKH